MYRNGVFAVSLLVVVIVLLIDSSEANPTRTPVRQRLDNISNKMDRVNRKLDKLKVGQNRQIGKLNRLLDDSGEQPQDGEEAAVETGRRSVFARINPFL